MSLPLLSFNMSSFHKGLPGITHIDKINFSKGDLFRQRNEMLNWYCERHPERISLLPCKVFSQLKKNRVFLQNDASVKENEEYWDADTQMESSVIKSTIGAKAQYKQMYQLFCKTSTTVNKTKICSNALFLQKYA
jgi:hypothetical protein